MSYDILFDEILLLLFLIYKKNIVTSTVSVPKLICELRV